MKWITVPALAMSLVVSPWVSANFINFTYDANGLVTQVFFDEAQLTEAEEAAAGGFFFTVFSAAGSVSPSFEGATITLVAPESTPEHLVISDVISFFHAGVGNTVVMTFGSDIDGMPPFSCSGCTSVMETGGIQDITATFNGIAGQTLPFSVLVRSDLAPSNVPEPGTLALLVLGLAGLGVFGRARGR